MAMVNPYEVIDRRLSAIESVLQELRRNHPPLPTQIPNSAAPITSAKQLKEWTNWPDGTFYAKVAEMPEGIVIRDKSKRLLFDTVKLIQWLKTPVEP